VAQAVEPCTAEAVAAPVSDGFRPPTQPWMPGNRGITFATRPGQVVRAVLGGDVVFAGPIAHQRYVTIRIADRRRVTYSFLASITVQVGDVVPMGATVGVTGTTPFQLGYLDGDAYLDPSPLLARACARSHAALVPIPAGS
jgi:murein DD-endopeptidase MepM/ murein hydrolase activator NlpD